MWQRFLGWARTHQNIVLWGIFAAVVVFSIAILAVVFSNGGNTESPAPGAGWFFLKLAFIGLIIAAVVSRERPYLAWTFSGIAGLIFMVLLGKFDSLFSWAVAGLPLVAAAAIYGATKTDADGRTRSFLGFASGIIILFWMYLFYQDHPVENTGFIGNVFFPDDTAKAISVVFLAVFIFAVWRRSRVMFTIAAVAFLCWIGGVNIGGKSVNMFDDVFVKRFPKTLLPSEKVQKTYKRGRDSLLDKISGAIETGRPSSVSSSPSDAEENWKIVRQPDFRGWRFGRTVALAPGAYHVRPDGAEIDLGSGWQSASEFKILSEGSFVLRDKQQRLLSLFQE